MERRIVRMQDTRFFLTLHLHSGRAPSPDTKRMQQSMMSYETGHLSIQGKKGLDLTMLLAESELEVPGHVLVLAHLAVSVDSSVPLPPENLDLDLFLTLRHFNPSGEGIPSRDSLGMRCPLPRAGCGSMRKVQPESPYHRSYLPR